MEVVEYTVVEEEGMGAKRKLEHDDEMEVSLRDDQK
jgi:hypothetical protein